MIFASWKFTSQILSFTPPLPPQKVHLFTTFLLQAKGLPNEGQTNYSPSEKYSDITEIASLYSTWSITQSFNCTDKGNLFW